MVNIIPLPFQASTYRKIIQLNHLHSDVFWCNLNMLNCSRDRLKSLNHHKPYFLSTMRS